MAQFVSAEVSLSKENTCLRPHHQPVCLQVTAPSSELPNLWECRKFSDESETIPGLFIVLYVYNTHRIMITYINLTVLSEGGD